MLGAALLALAVPDADAATLHVCATCKFTDVPSAVAASASGDVVQVGAGTWTGDLAIPHDLTVQGGAGVTIQAAITIDHATVTLTSFALQGSLAAKSASLSLVDLTVTGSGITLTSVTTTMTGSTLDGMSPAVSAVGGRFSSDHDTWNGNAQALVVSNAATKVDTDVFEGNGGSANGGAIAISDSTLSVTQSGFSGDTAASGAAIFATNTGVTIDGSDFSGETATGDGGALAIVGGSLTVGTSTFEADSATNGGAISADGATAIRVAGDAFFGCTADTGGAISAANVPDAAVQGCTLVENTAVFGGGLYADSSACTILVDDFLANAAGGAAMGGGAYLLDSSADVRNVLFAWTQGGDAVTTAGKSKSVTLEYDAWFDNVTDVSGGLKKKDLDATNVLVDPQLLAYSADGDSSNDDLRLQSDSPLLAAGDPSVFNPDGGRSDIGVYGGPDALGYDVDTDGDGVPYAHDCVDSDAAVHPGAREHCDGADEDCDGVVDESSIDEQSWAPDADHDGYGDESAIPVLACTGPAGSVADATDCNDANPEIHPGAPEVCNGLDDDCNGKADEGLAKKKWYPDGDSDGYGVAAGSVSACAQPAGFAGVSGDCDDSNPSVHPGVPEVCNGIDDDCDGTTDQNPVIGPAWYVDGDSDGFGAGKGVVACTAPTGRVEVAGDCDDSDPASYPGAIEQCDGADNDCDSSIDEEVRVVAWYADADGDGYGDVGTVTSDCRAPVGYVANHGDCDDTLDTVHPGATEVCNGIDDDCNGRIDEGTKSRFWVDADADGYGAGAAVEACGLTDGYASRAGDCDDSNPAVYPGALEVCNGVDDDCDGLVDDGASDGTVEYYRDADHDSWGDPASSIVGCPSGPPDGYVANSDDCDDTNRKVHPHATEVCNGIDDNCNGFVDVDATGTRLWYLDADGDGHGVATSTIESCLRPAGYASGADDCDDSNSLVHPGAIEQCNSADDDCDGSIDEDDAAIDYYVDADHDGFGDATRATVKSCAPGPSYAPVAGDCDDTDADVHPGAVEVCNGVDDDCNGTIDDPTADGAEALYADADGDGWGDGQNPLQSCPIAGYAAKKGDCDDTDPVVHPKAPEICDGKDNDCDGVVDDHPTDGTRYYPDADGDGYGVGAGQKACAQPDHTATVGGDCNDADAGVHPGAVEILGDGIDQDCDGHDLPASSGRTWGAVDTGPAPARVAGCACDSAPTPGAAWALGLLALLALRRRR